LRLGSQSMGTINVGFVRDARIGYMTEIEEVGDASNARADPGQVESVTIPTALEI